MRIMPKLHFKKFFTFSLVTLAAFCMMAKNLSELYVILGVYIATLVNLVFLSEGIFELTRRDVYEDDSTQRIDRDKVIYLFIGKILVLVLALTLGVQIIGNRIIIALINYVIQIFILVLCLKKSESVN